MTLIFFGQKWGPNQWFYSREKSSKSLNNFFFEKQNLPACLYKCDLQNGVRNIFWNKWVSRYLGFSDFKILKNSLQNKIVNKTRSTKNQENFAHHLGDNYLANHLVKVLQDRSKTWRVGALRLCTGYHFFKENRQWGLSNLL